MSRILGIDFGEARTGVSVSDELGLLANGIGTVYEKDVNRLLNRLAEKAKELGVSEIVMGNPVNMDGTAGEKSQKIARFAKRLEEKTGIPVKLFDERLSTVVAHTILNETDTRGKKRKKVVDTLSSEIILQNYLDYLKQQK